MGSLFSTVFLYISTEMNKEIIIKNIARSIYKNQRDGRPWDLTNYDGCMEMADEIFEDIEKELNSYQREIKINTIINE